MRFCTIRSATRVILRLVSKVQAPNLASNPAHLRCCAAFSLLEVMLAVAILFIAMFGVLGLTSQCLRSARSLQMPRVDASSLAAELSLTNRLTEGRASGDFGDIYPGYTWESEVSLASSNGLYQVDFIVFNPGQQVESTMSILLYRPGSVIGAVGAGTRGRR
jgi:Tfp pilus assembly protein PilV